MSRHPVHGHSTPRLALRRNYCFGCGRDNPDGMRLKFHYEPARRRFVARFRLTRRYTGPPGHAHGGIVATLLDEAMGKVNKLHGVVALTRSMEVEYLRPVPLHQPLTVESHSVRVRGRRHLYAASILDAKGKGEVLARGRGTFIAVDPARLQRMFGPFL